MQAVSLSSWTTMITSLLSALWSKQTQLEEQRVVTGAGTQGDLYLDLGTTSDHFGFPASLPAESKREWEKHECIDEHRIWPECGGKQLPWTRVGKTAQKGNENRRNLGEEGRFRKGPPIPLQRVTSPTGLMEALYLCGWSSYGGYKA